MLRKARQVPHCDTSRYSWCSQDSTWVPSTPCPAETSHMCLALVHADPEWDKGQLAQLIASYGLRIGIAYYGPLWTDMVKMYYKAQREVLFYLWEPDPLLVLTEAKRVSFPDAGGGCETVRDPLRPELSPGDTWSASSNCDF